MSKKSATIIQGETETLTVTKTLPNTGVTIAWSSSDTSVATVSDGVITAKAAGTAKITASGTYTGSQTGKAECTVTVTAASVTLPETESVAAGDTVTLTATTVPAGKALTWSSSDENTATVENGVVTGEAEGTATITASFDAAGTTISDTCTVTVTSASA